MPRKSVNDYCGRCSRRVRQMFAIVEGNERMLCTNCDARIIRMLATVVALRDSNPEPTFDPEMAQPVPVLVPDGTEIFTERR